MFRFSSQPQRGRLYVDGKFQRTLLIRVCLYWLLVAVATALVLLCGSVIFSPVASFDGHLAAVWAKFGPFLAVSIMLLPIVLVDVLKVSNRMVGPILRLRGGLRSLAQGSVVEPIRFREGDFWREFADEYNAVARQLNQLRQDQTNLPQESAAK